VVELNRKLYEVHTPIMLVKDAGYADNKIQLGIARAHYLAGTIVVALNRKTPKTPTIDLDASQGTQMSFRLSQFLRQLGIEWRLVPAQGVGPTICLPSMPI
jgi:hypothetical protein